MEMCLPLLHSYAEDTFNCTGFILRTHASFRLRPAFEKTSFECEGIFFPVQRACYLDNSRIFVARGAERVS